MTTPRETSDSTYTREPSLATALAGRFDVGEEIGRGGSGIVYRGRRSSDGLAVAIKVLRPEVAGEIPAERFHREMSIESKLIHRNITPVLESGAIGQLPYFVLPLAEGGSLRRRLEQQHELPLDEALGITRDIVAALACAHAQRIVHRDVKPENILLGDGHAYLTDFGIARVLGELDAERITESGIALGTPAYMSPEQGASDRTLDGRTDLYSLACVLYEMLTGDPPFAGRSSRAILARHAHEPVRGVRAIRASIPTGVEYALLRALEKTPADRFATVDEFLRALASPPPAGWVAPADVAGVEASRRRRWWISGVSMIAAAAAWMIIANRAPPPDANKVMLFPLAGATVERATNPGWSVALAINQSLEHAMPLRGLDGWSYLDTTTRADVSRLSSRAARRLAQSRGARYYVTGAIARTGDTTRVTLQLFDALSDTLVAQESAGGAGDEAAVVQSGLRAAARLLPRLLDPGRTIDVEVLASRSKSALALWIQGERAYRQADFAGSLEFFRRALAEDSTFALAALRGAQAASWPGDQDLAARLVAVAVANDSLLPRGRASLAHGFDAFLRGDADSAVHWLRLALQQMPDAADAPMLLGEAYHHLVRAGGDDSLATVQFREAAARDTSFTPPLVHLAEIAIRAGDLRAGQRYITRLQAVKSDSTFMRQLVLMRDCVRDRRIDWAAAAKANLTAVVQASHELAVAGRQPECAEDAFRATLETPSLSPPFAWHALLGLQGLLVAEGRGPEARVLLDAELAAGRTKAMLLYGPDALAGAPTADKTTEFTTYTRARYGDTFEKSSALVRWMLTVLHARGADSAMVEQISASVQRLADSTRQRGDRAIAAAIAAHSILARGDTAGAIAHFRALRPSARSQTLLSDAFESLAVERLVLARLLLARGEYTEAENVAATFDQPQPIMNLPFLAESLRIREEAATKRLQPRIADEMRARLRALRAAGDSRRRP